MGTDTVSNRLEFLKQFFHLIDNRLVAGCCIILGSIHGGRLSFEGIQCMLCLCMMFMEGLEGCEAGGFFLRMA